MPLLRLEADTEFTWQQEHQKVLSDIKGYLSSPQIVPPKAGISFRLYLSTNQKSIGPVLIQEQGDQKNCMCGIVRLAF